MFSVKQLFVASLFWLPLAAIAGGASGQIQNIWLANDAYAVFFDLSEPMEGTPRCNETKRFAIDLRRPGGEAAYRGLLRAKENGWTVDVSGLNTCRVHYQSEDLKQLIIK